MAALSQTPAAIAWLKKFPAREQPIATRLIEEILLVSRDDFANDIRDLVNTAIAKLPAADQRIALYAERPIKKVFGIVPSFFPKSRQGRAKGPGVQPVVVNARDQEVGSEGLVAQFITDYCRQHPSTAFPHPGPTKLRKEKVRVIAIVTDFIGSGDRVTTMLEAFRYVATLRSWRSLGLIEFWVLAYSGTPEGIEYVRSHKLRPVVHIVAGCPTIWDTFLVLNVRRSMNSAALIPQTTPVLLDTMIRAHSSPSLIAVPTTSRQFCIAVGQVGHLSSRDAVRPRSTTHLVYRAVQNLISEPAAFFA
jgi:hypothetical protein